MAEETDPRAEIELLKAQLHHAQDMLEAELRQRIALERQLQLCQEQLANLNRR